MQYDLSRIMRKAWANYRKYPLDFAEALHRAWLSIKAENVNQERINAKKVAQGITEHVQTWSGWKSLGFEVIHGSKALFGVELIWGSKGDGATYKAKFFGASQVRPIDKAVSA